MKRSWVLSSFDEPEQSSPPTARLSGGRQLAKSPSWGSDECNKKCVKESIPKKTQCFGSPIKKQQQLWCDDSVSREQLAVHNKKVQEVEAWLLSAFTHTKGHRILLLTGPAGSGKTACVRALVAEMGLTIKEWINGTKQPYTAADPGCWVRDDCVPELGQVTQFKEFVLRVNKYGSVVTSHTNTCLLLVEDLPNSFYRDPEQFHDILRRYACSGRSPAVFIVSDSPQQEQSARRLFPQHLHQPLALTTVQFNPVAVTLLQRALQTLLVRHHVSLQQGSVEEVAAAAQGDIRTAVNTLQFAAQGVRSTGGAARSAVRKGRKRTNSTTTAAAAAAAAAPLSVGSKDTQLLMFRALGKVLYCKRTDLPVPPLPLHLRSEERRPALETAEDVLERSCLTPSTFIGFLHHNWKPFMGSIAAASTALRYTCDADCIMAEWTDRDVLSQYGCVAARGVMHVTGAAAAAAFRAITTPEWGEVRMTATRRMDALREAYPSRQLHSVTTDTLPYAALIRRDTYTNDCHLVREVGLWGPSAGVSLPPPTADPSTTDPPLGETLDYDSDITDVPD